MFTVKMNSWAGLGAQCERCLSGVLSTSGDVLCRAEDSAKV